MSARPMILTPNKWSEGPEALCSFMQHLDSRPASSKTEMQEMKNVKLVLWNREHWN